MRTAKAYCVERHEPEHEGRTKSWQSMRILREFSLADLQVTAEVTYDSAKKYVRLLERAGYLLRVVRHSGQPGSYARWRLVRDSGPVAPILRGGLRPDRVYDPNLQEVFGAGATPAGGAA